MVGLLPDVLLQDDSGVPLAWLGAAANSTLGPVLPQWDVLPFGGYAAGPSAEPYAQPPLQRIFDEHPRGPRSLGPLRYGYCLRPQHPSEAAALGRQGALADALARDAAEATEKGAEKRDPEVCNAIVGIRRPAGEGQRPQPS